MKKFTIIFLTLTVAFVFEQANAQRYWKDISKVTAGRSSVKRLIIPNTFRTLSLNVSDLKSVLAKASVEGLHQRNVAAITLAVPYPDGTVQHFSVVECNMMEPKLREKFPNIKTYRGQGIEDRTATITLDWTEAGFHAMVLSDVSGSVWIDPYAQGNTSEYISYYKKDLNAKSFFEEGLLMPDKDKVSLMRAATGGVCVGGTLRTYRLAVACTFQYARAVGATNASLLHSAIVTTVNRVNGVYEKELAIRMVLIANNNAIEFRDSATTPFTGNGNAGTLIKESQKVIDSIIGTANYDIGHTFSTGAGGLAALGVVCNAASKAKGVTGRTNPTGDAYDIDYVAHEIGHQFGANHTFNANTNSCRGNGSSTTNAEPGSGTTIMAYAGICGATNNLQPNSDPHFHAVSFNEITTYTNTANGNTCAVKTNTGNNAPVVNAGANYNIPISTPFKLTGSATDANGDALTYSWEEMDVAGAFGNWNAPTGAAPLFRSFRPIASPERIFPKMSDIVNNVTTIGEILPSYAREMNFRLTARDNRAGGGGVCFGNMKVTASGTAAFTVTSQAGSTTWNANGTRKATITWNVAGTNAAPVSVANVDILLSTDGGYTYPTTLIANTANDGSEEVVIPIAATRNGRIMVRSVGNIFFNINSGNIVITDSCALLTCPSSMQASVAGACSDSLTLEVPAFGKCSKIIKVTWKLTGATTGTSADTGINVLRSRRLNVGTTTITYYVKDSIGKTASCSFTVTLKETTKPTITVPANIVKYVTTTCTPVIYIPKPTFADNCAVASLSWVLSGATSDSSAKAGINYIGSRSFNNGVTNIVFTVSDKSGNTATGTFKVTVMDTTRPYIKFMPNYTVYAPIDSCGKTISIADPIITDGCAIASVSWTMSGATYGSSPTFGINYLGTQLFIHGNTTVTYTVKDVNGNTSTISFLVRVKEQPGGTCSLGGREIYADEMAPNETLQVRLSPNPTVGQFKLKVVSDNKDLIHVNVYSISGKRIESVLASVNKEVYFGNNYVRGAYLIEVIQGEKRTTITGIKQ